MFEERLSAIRGRVGGALAVSLVARDGIPVESDVADSSLDLEVLAAELLTQVREIADDHRELSVGAVRQFSITTDRYTLMLGALTEDYFLLLVLGENGNFGRARYELRRAPLEFARDL